MEFVVAHPGLVVVAVFAGLSILLAAARRIVALAVVLVLVVGVAMLFAGPRAAVTAAAGQDSWSGRWDCLRAGITERAVLSGERKPAALAACASARANNAPATRPKRKARAAHKKDAAPRRPTITGR